MTDSASPASHYSPPMESKSTTDILRSLIAEDNYNTLTIMAEALNLYTFSISKSRVGADRHWTADDVARFLNITLMYLSIGEVENQLAKMSGRPQRTKTD